MNAIYLLGKWGKQEPQLYQRWIERSQGLEERSAKAELLQTLRETIEERKWPVSIVFNADKWLVALVQRESGEQFAAEGEDLGLALLSAYTEAVTVQVAVKENKG